MDRASRPVNRSIAAIAEHGVIPAPALTAVAATRVRQVLVRVLRHSSVSNVEPSVAVGSLLALAYVDFAATIGAFDDLASVLREEAHRIFVSATVAPAAAAATMTGTR